MVGDTFDIKKEIGVVAWRENGERLILNWGNWPRKVPCYDLRWQWDDKNGKRKYGEGMTLSAEELNSLYRLLSK